jgi:hypothetical protein
VNNDERRNLITCFGMKKRGLIKKNDQSQNQLNLAADWIREKRGQKSKITSWISCLDNLLDVNVRNWINNTGRMTNPLMRNGNTLLCIPSTIRTWIEEESHIDVYRDMSYGYIHYVKTWFFKDIYF